MNSSCTSGAWSLWSQILGLFAGTVITKETKEGKNNRVLLAGLLFGCIVSFVLRNLRLGTYRRDPNTLCCCLVAGIARSFNLTLAIGRWWSLPTSAPRWTLTYYSSVEPLQFLIDDGVVNLIESVSTWLSLTPFMNVSGGGCFNLLYICC